MQTSQENEEAEEAQIWVQKKGDPPEKLGSIRSSRGSWAAPSRARGFEQETTIRAATAATTAIAAAVVARC